MSENCGFGKHGNCLLQQVLSSVGSFICHGDGKSGAGLT